MPVMYEPVSKTSESLLNVSDTTRLASTLVSESQHSFAESLRQLRHHRHRSDSSHVAGKEHQLGIDSENSSERPSRGCFRYIFTPEGRNLARRKLLTSGPAFKETSSPTTTSGRNLFARYTGWRMGTLVCLSAVSLCLIVETIFLLVALSVSMGGFGSGLLYKGSCSRVKNLTIWLLFPLNIVATVLISTSNYVMQVMAAPDRKEVDYAHSLATSVTIAGMRFRNLQFGGRRRRLIWWILGISSLPIHVLLNSAIYGSVQASDSGVLVVNDDFGTDIEWKTCGSTFPQDIKTDAFACALMQEFFAGKTVELSPQQCLRQYADGFQRNASSVIVVTKNSSSDHYLSLPDPGLIGMIGSGLGIACQQDSTGNNFLEIPASQRRYKLDFDPSSGDAQAYVPFMVHCSNTSQTSDGRKTQVIGQGDMGPSLYSASSALFVTSEDLLLNVSSFRSAFSAFEYRYWATAQLLEYDLNSPDLTFASQGWDPRAWLCPREDLTRGIECDPTQLDVTKEAWYITPASIQVTACHVLPTKEQCALRYSTSILAVLLVTDLVKLAAMLMALKITTQPLATLGDAIESFLKQPDVYTENRCLLDADSARKWSQKAAPLVKDEALRATLYNIPGYNSRASRRLVKHDQKNLYYTELRATRTPVYQKAEADSNISKPFLATQAQYGGQNWSKVIPPALPESWKPRQHRWLVVPSKSRWFYYLCFFATLAAPTSLVFIYGLQSLRKQRFANFWTVGLSGPDPNALFTGGVLNTNDILPTAIIINTPQLLFSMLYFLFNALITMMHTAHEWSTFTTARKALRVSCPRGQQRSTYWLQLPWRYSIPLIIASGTLHWLLGRSIYVVKVDVYGFFGDREASKDFFACGYSPLTILGLVVVLGVMVGALTVLSVRRLGGGSPVVKLNSFAIAAACHRRFEDEDMVTVPLMWGVVTDEKGEETRHCTFSARKVSPLVEGGAYE